MLGAGKVFCLLVELEVTKEGTFGLFLDD